MLSAVSPMSFIMMNTRKLNEHLLNERRERGQLFLKSLLCVWFQVLYLDVLILILTTILQNR